MNGIISSLAKQTQSANPHLRNWGCLFHDLIAMPQDLFGVQLSTKDIEHIFESCISTGFIYDNNEPITKTSRWYRAFCADKDAIIQAASLYISGKTIRAKELYRGAICIASIDTNYSIIEYKTTNGSHFIQGWVNNDLSIREIYNPGLNIKGLKPIGVRHWQVTL